MLTIQDTLVSRLIVESLAKNGTVTLEEAKFYTDFTKAVLNKVIEEVSAELEETAQISRTEEINESSTSNIVRKLIK